MAQISTLLDDPHFLEFYVAAKKNGYGSGKKVHALIGGGKQHIFADMDWPEYWYSDTWYGHNPFWGRELIEIRGASTRVPFLTAQMSYDGYSTGTEEEVESVFAFLRKILQQNVSVDSPFRGPDTLVREDGLQYWCSWKSKNPFCVQGEEVIQPFTSERMGPIIYKGSFQFCTLR